MLKRNIVIGVVVLFIALGAYSTAMEINSKFKSYDEQIASLNEEKNKLNETINSLIEENNLLNTDLENKTKELKQKTSELAKFQSSAKRTTSLSSRSGYNRERTNWWVGQGQFKSYMNYTCITSPNSLEKKLQDEATTNSDGLRVWNGYIMVAIGTGHGFKVGDTFTITLSNGYSFKAIMGDTKSSSETKGNIMHGDGSIVEFIVDTKKLDSNAKRMGNISYVTGGKYQGGIISII